MSSSSIPKPLKPLKPIDTPSASSNYKTTVLVSDGNGTIMTFTEPSYSDTTSSSTMERITSSAPAGHSRNINFGIGAMRKWRSA